VIEILCKNSLKKWKVKILFWGLGVMGFRVWRFKLEQFLPNSLNPIIPQSHNPQTLVQILIIKIYIPIKIT
jgi:hypothetical protein